MTILARPPAIQRAAETPWSSLDTTSQTLVCWLPSHAVVQDVKGLEFRLATWWGQDLGPRLVPDLTVL